MHGCRLEGRVKAVAKVMVLHRASTRAAILSFTEGFLATTGTDQSSAGEKIVLELLRTMSSESRMQTFKPPALPRPTADPSPLPVKRSRKSWICTGRMSQVEVMPVAAKGVLEF
jgi:hypothetical protein